MNVTNEKIKIHVLDHSGVLDMPNDKMHLNRYVCCNSNVSVQYSMLKRSLFRLVKFTYR